MSCGWVFGGALTGQAEVEGSEVGVDVTVIGRGGYAARYRGHEDFILCRGSGGGPGGAQGGHGVQRGYGGNEGDPSLVR